MGKFRVAERFVSVNGEGKRAGQLSYFIRFAGCNLDCGYCDTKWANEADAECFEYDENALYTMIKGSGIKNVTLTGGEPLAQKEMMDLLKVLRRDENLRIEIETNGSIDIHPFMVESNELAERIYHHAAGSFGMTLQDMMAREEMDWIQRENIVDNVSFTMDYKLGCSGMESKMCLTNLEWMRDTDTVKFVVGDRQDLDRCLEVVRKYRLLQKKCAVYISPCYGKIEPSEIVEYMKQKKLNDVNLQLQLHKYIWPQEQKGV